MITSRIASMDVAAFPTTQVDADTAALAAWIERGDRAALDGLFRRHADLALRLAGRRLGNPSDAEDAVQEAFVGSMRGARGFRPGRGSVRGWLMAAVLNACHEQKRGEGRRRRREAAGGMPPHADDPDPDLAETIATALGELPAQQRGPIELRYFAGLEFPEIARALGRPERTVRGQVSRGLEALRTICARLGFATSVPALESAILAMPMPAPAPDAIARCAGVAHHGQLAATAATGGTVVAFAGLALVGAIAVWTLHRPAMPPPASSPANFPAPAMAADPPTAPPAAPVTTHLMVAVQQRGVTDHPDVDGRLPALPAVIIGSRQDQPSPVRQGGLLWGAETMDDPATDTLIAAASAGTLPRWSAAGADDLVWLALFSPPMLGRTLWAPVAIERSGPEIRIRIIACALREFYQRPLTHRHAWTLGLEPLPAGDYHLSVEVDGFALQRGGAVPLPKRICASGSFTVQAAHTVHGPATSLTWTADALAADTDRSVKPGTYWQEPDPSWIHLGPALVATHPTGLLGVYPGNLSAWQAALPPIPSGITSLPAPAPLDDGDAVALIRPPHDDTSLDLFVAGVTWQDQSATINLEAWTISGGPYLRRQVWDGSLSMLVVPLTRPPVVHQPGHPDASLNVQIRWRHFNDAGDGRGYVETPVPEDWTTHATWSASH